MLNPQPRSVYASVCGERGTFITTSMAAMYPLALTSRAISRFQDLEFTSGTLRKAVSVHLFDQFVRGGQNTRFANQSVCSDPEGWWMSRLYPRGGLRGFRWGRILGCHVTEFVPHKALQLIA